MSTACSPSAACICDWKKGLCRENEEEMSQHRMEGSDFVSSIEQHSDAEINAPSDDEEVKMAVCEEEQEDVEEEIHPIFMTGLPSGFSTNAGLAALASLLEEESESKDVDGRLKPLESYLRTEMSGSVSGGKISRSAEARKLRTASAGPYSVQKTPRRSKNEATVSEVQLFLNMWKL